MGNNHVKRETGDFCDCAFAAFFYMSTQQGRVFCLQLHRRGSRGPGLPPPGLKDVQIMERRLSRASNRIADAAASGFSTYRKRRNRSARRKRDGAIRDLLPNSARGMGRSLRRMSLVPYDLARAVNTRTVRRMVRRRLRFTSGAVRGFLG